MTQQFTEYVKSDEDGFLGSPTAFDYEAAMEAYLQGTNASVIGSVIAEEVITNPSSNFDQEAIDKAIEGVNKFTEGVIDSTLGVIDKVTDSVTSPLKKLTPLLIGLGVCAAIAVPLIIKNKKGSGE